MPLRFRSQEVQTLVERALALESRWITSVGALLEHAHDTLRRRQAATLNVFIVALSVLGLLQSLPVILAALQDAGWEFWPEVAFAVLLFPAVLSIALIALLCLPRRSVIKRWILGLAGSD